MAIVKTPARMTVFEFEPVPECRPTISPSIEMTADVSPSEMPVRNQSFIFVSTLSIQLYVFVKKLHAAKISVFIATGDQGDE